MDARERPDRPRWPGRVLLEGALVAALWLLFAGSAHWHDLVVAAVLGIGTASVSRALRHRLGHRPAGVGAWLRLAPSVVLGILRDSLLVTKSLADLLRGRAVAGEVVEVPFDVGGAVPEQHEGRAPDTTRRVLATVLTTMQPNTVLLGFDHARDVAIVHRLRETDRPAVDPRLTDGGG